jgi:hypothetical protein
MSLLAEKFHSEGENPFLPLAAFVVAAFSPLIITATNRGETGHKIWRCIVSNKLRIK